MNAGKGLEGRRGHGCRGFPSALLCQGIAGGMMTALLLPPPQPPVAPARGSLTCH